MRPDVLALYRAAMATASTFPMHDLRPKLHQNMREMFLAHRNVVNPDQITRLVECGWRDLRTFKSIAAQDKKFYESISRKTRKTL